MTTTAISSAPVEKSGKTRKRRKGITSQQLFVGIVLWRRKTKDRCHIAVPNPSRDPRLGPPTSHDDNTISILGGVTSGLNDFAVEHRAEIATSPFFLHISLADNSGPNQVPGRVACAEELARIEAVRAMLAGAYLGHSAPAALGARVEALAAAAPTVSSPLQRDAHPPRHHAVHASALARFRAAPAGARRRAGSRIVAVHAQSSTKRRLHTIIVFVQSAGTLSLPVGIAAKHDGYTLVRWTNAGLEFWAVSDIDLDEL